MKGYIFEYYKYVRYPKIKLEDIKPCLDYDKAEESILTFGEYDRLKINQITYFDRFRDLSELARKWVGNRQSILLFDLDDQPPFAYLEENGKSRFQNTETKEFDQHLFWSVTELSFCNVLREKMQPYQYSTFLKEVQNQLEDIISKNCSAGITEHDSLDATEYNITNTKKCDYMILGTLGTFGISILWFSNQYTDILELVNKIKQEGVYKSKRMYLSAHTMISRNPMYDGLKSHIPLTQSIKGNALIQVTLKKWINHNLVFLRDSRVRKRMHTSGEYDLFIEMDSKDVFIDFEEKEIFDHNTDKYQNNILQTKVILARELNNNDLQDDLEEKSEEDKLSYYLNDIEKVYKDLRKLMLKKINKKAGIIDTLDSLHCDYRYNVASAVNQSWANDFYYVFKKNLECIGEIINSVEDYGIDPMFLIRTVMNNLKQQIFHISEANNLNLEIPKCHMRYTGQEDCILFAYMGIIKDILYTAYNLKSYNKQTEIIPIVTVDVVPIIESEIYFDKSSCINIKSEDINQADQNFKILSLNLPHVTFYDIPTYISYLHHEIYHYIVPEDRERRDYILGSFLTTIYIESVIYTNLSWQYDDKIEILHQILSYIKPLVYDTVVGNYSMIHDEVTGFRHCNLKVETDLVVLIEKVYKDQLINHISGKGTYLEHIIRTVYKRLCKGDFKKLSFEDLQKHLEKEHAEGAVKQLEEWFERMQGDKWHLETDTAFEVINKIADGMEEVSADIAMIELLDTPLEEYMLLLSQCLKNELKAPEMNWNTELKEFIRTGVVLGFYQSKHVSVADVREKFIYSYIAKYIDLLDDNLLKIKEKINELKFEAENWWLHFYHCKKRYMKEFKLYQRHLQLLTQTYSMKNRISDQEKQEKLYLKKHRELYNTMRKNVEKIESMCYSIDDDNEKKLTEIHTIWGKFCEDIFTENIRLINYFQTQKNLEELHNINRENNKDKSKNNDKYIPPVIPEIFAGGEREYIKRSFDSPSVYALDSFLQEINNAAKHLEQSCITMFGRKKYVLWYRGQGNSSYELLPNIMRKTNIAKRDYNYLAQYQRSVVEEFKYRADGAPEVMDRSHYGISDYLALMQHYGVNTNLMDWSEDAFTALYFALSKIITRKVLTSQSDVSIYVFSPHLYNEARNYMINEAAKITFCTESAFLASIRTAERNDGLIPNIATSYNKEIYDMFLMGNLKYESRNRYGYIRKIELNGQEEMAYLPLAVYTSRLNPRIKLQSGIFVAYNLYIEPQNSMDAYSYMSLEKIQDYYLKHCRRENKERFLYKIVIEREAATEIAECMIRLGFSEERIYPELENIGKRIV